VFPCHRSFNKAGEPNDLIYLLELFSSNFFQGIGVSCATIIGAHLEVTAFRMGVLDVRGRKPIISVESESNTEIQWLQFNLQRQADRIIPY
jgi:hypothetical protein